MAVTARFIVSRLTPMGSPEKPWATEVEMTPDYAEGRNEEWKAASPSGVFRLTVSQEAPALREYEVGKPVHIIMEFPDE